MRAEFEREHTGDSSKVHDKFVEQTITRQRSAIPLYPKECNVVTWMKWPRNCWIQKVEKGIPLKKKEIVEMKPRARGMLEKEQVTCKFLLVFRAGVPTSTLPRTAKLLGVIIHYWGWDKKISHCIEKLLVCHRGETQTFSFVTKLLLYSYTLTSLTFPLTHCCCYAYQSVVQVCSDIE